MHRTNWQWLVNYPAQVPTLPVGRLSFQGRLCGQFCGPQDALEMRIILIMRCANWATGALGPVILPDVARRWAPGTRDHLTLKTGL